MNTSNSTKNFVHQNIESNNECSGNEGLYRQRNIGTLCCKYQFMNAFTYVSLTVVPCVY